MHFTSILVPAALFLASGCHAWAQAANGVWVANNTFYNIRGCKFASPPPWGGMHACRMSKIQIRAPRSELIAPCVFS